MLFYRIFDENRKAQKFKTISLNTKFKNINAYIFIVYTI